MKLFAYSLTLLSLAILLAGCGGGGGGGGPEPVPTATPRPTATPVPTPTPVGTPRPTPTPGTPPGVVFDLRGRVYVSGVAASGVTVTVTGQAGATTPSDSTVTGVDGSYSFFLGAGSYTVTAVRGTLSATRTVTIPAGGQTVDNFNLTL